MKFSRKLLYNVLPLRQTQKRCIYSIIVTLSDSRFQYSASSSASVKRVCALAFPQNADAMHRPSEGEMDGNCKNAAERSLQFPLFDERMRMQCTASRTARDQTLLRARTDSHNTKGRRISAASILFIRSFIATSYYSMISVTTPDPTVLPPSRIANLSPSSIAIGVISSISITTLSPGMHISVPSGR